MQRRTAIGMLGTVAGGPLLARPDGMERLLEWAARVRSAGGGARSADESDANGGPPNPPTTLTPVRARAMEALAEAIIPATDDSPGAAEAGVTEFVTALVEGWLDDDERDRFLEDLDRVDHTSRERFGASFAELGSADQAILLGEWDEEAAARDDDADGQQWSRFPHSIDFRTIKRFALTAFFTSEAGLAALGHRTVFSTFEGCLPLEPPR